MQENSVGKLTDYDEQQPTIDDDFNDRDMTLDLHSHNLITDSLLLDESTIAGQIGDPHMSRILHKETDQSAIRISQPLPELS